MCDLFGNEKGINAMPTMTYLMMKHEPVLTADWQVYALLAVVVVGTATVVAYLLLTRK